MSLPQRSQRTQRVNRKRRQPLFLCFAPWTLWQLNFAVSDLGRDRSKFLQWLFEFYLQDASPRIQNPIVSCSNRVKLGPAQPKAFPQEPLCTITVVRLAYRLFGSRDAHAMSITFGGQNENRHKTAFKTLSVLINP